MAEGLLNSRMGRQDKGMYQRMINHDLLFQYQMMVNDNVLPFPLQPQWLPRHALNNPHHQPHYLLMFPENQVGLEEEECVVSTVLTLGIQVILMTLLFYIFGLFYNLLSAFVTCATFS